MGVVKSKYWRRKNRSKTSEPQQGDTLAPRPTPTVINSEKPIVEQILSQENYIKREDDEFMDVCSLR